MKSPREEVKAVGGPEFLAPGEAGGQSVNRAQLWILSVGSGLTLWLPGQQGRKGVSAANSASRGQSREGPGDLQVLAPRQMYYLCL